MLMEGDLIAELAQSMARQSKRVAVLARTALRPLIEQLRGHARYIGDAAIQAGSSANTNTWLKDKTDPSWVYGYDATTVPLQ